MSLLIKQREIVFHAMHPIDNQAREAMVLLVDLEGIDYVTELDPLRLIVHYDISKITLVIIEELLCDLGFHLDNSLLLKLMRALHYYTEDTERANLGCRETRHKTTRDVFIRQYCIRQHGCRDTRPEHWRNYL